MPYANSFWVVYKRSESTDLTVLSFLARVPDNKIYFTRGKPNGTPSITFLIVDPSFLANGLRIMREMVALFAFIAGFSSPLWAHLGIPWWSYCMLALDVRGCCVRVIWFSVEGYSSVNRGCRFFGKL